MPRLPEGPLGFDGLGFSVETVGHGTDVKILWKVDGRNIPLGPDYPNPIKGKALIVQATDGSLHAIRHPHANLDVPDINIHDFVSLDPALRVETLNAIAQNREDKRKRKRIGQLTTSTPNP